MTPEVDYDIALEIAAHEAIIRQAYKDSEGNWTWSVGLTSATGHNVERYIDNPQPLDKCLSVYVWALKNYARAVDQAFAGCALTKAQYAGACSFHWNTGAIAKASWVRHFKEGNMEAAEKAFLEWRNPPTIRERRQKEADLIFRGQWSNSGTMTEYPQLTAAHTPKWSSAARIDVSEALRHAFTEVDVSPPQVDQEPDPDARVAPAAQPLKPLSKSKELISSGTQIVGGAGGLLVAFSQLDKWVQIAFVGIFGLVIVAGLVLFGNRIVARIKGLR